MQVFRQRVQNAIVPWREILEGFAVARSVSTGATATTTATRSLGTKTKDLFRRLLKRGDTTPQNR